MAFFIGNTEVIATNAAVVTQVVSSSETTGNITAVSINTANLTVNSGITFGDGSRITSGYVLQSAVIAGNVTVTGTTPANPGLFLPATNTLGFSTNNTLRMILDPVGNVGIGSSTAVVALDLRTRTDALIPPRGTTAQRPASPQAGMLRWNSTSSAFEGYYGTQWNAVPVMTYNLLSISTSGSLLQDQVLSGDANASFDVLNNAYISGFFSPQLSLSFDSLGNLVATF